MSADLIWKHCIEELYLNLYLKETSVARGIEIPCSYSQGYMFGYEDGRSPQDVLHQFSDDDGSDQNHYSSMLLIITRRWGTVLAI